MNFLKRGIFFFPTEYTKRFDTDNLAHKYKHKSKQRHTHTNTKGWKMHCRCTLALYWHLNQHPSSHSISFRNLSFSHFSYGAYLVSEFMQVKTKPHMMCTILLASFFYTWTTVVLELRQLQTPPPSLRARNFSTPSDSRSLVKLNFETLVSVTDWIGHFTHSSSLPVSDLLTRF